MNDYNVLFYLYLSFVCLLLFVFAVFVSLQLKSLCLYIVVYFEVFTFDKSSFVFLIKDYQNFYYLYSTISNYALFISLSELCLESQTRLLDRKNIYFSLARIYRDLFCWGLAEHYYLKALSLGSDDAQIISSLANMYNYLGCPENAKTFDYQILT